MLYSLQVIHRAATFNEQCDLVDALIHPVVTHALGTVKFAVRGIEGQFEGQRQRIGIIPGMRGRMGGRTDIGNAGLFEPFGGQARRSHRNIEHLGDRSAYCTLVFRRVTEHHVVRHDAPLTIGRISQIVQPRLACQRMWKFDGVAYGINVCRGGLQIVVHPDPARIADSEAGHFG